MKKLLFFIIFLFITFSAYNQDKVLLTDKAKLNKTLELRGTSVDSILIDTSLNSNSNNTLASSKAIKGYVDNRIGSGNSSFNSNRQILRMPTVGTVIGGSTIQDYLEWQYFAPATITLNLSPGTTIYEVGTSTSITLSGTTNNPGSATLSNGVLIRTVPPANIVNNFGSNTSYSSQITFSPQQGGSGDYNELDYTFVATQDWVSGSENGIASSGTRTLKGVYPILWGMGASDTSVVLSDLYGTLNKAVVDEGNKTYSYTGNGLIYYAFPSSWSDTNLTSIIDPNGFNVTSSFTRVTYPVVTSTGLTNNYSNVSYTVYFLNTGQTTTSASQYTFNQ